MEKITKPKVRTLAAGSELIAKQMQASSGDLLPKHKDNVESVLFVHEGECVFDLDGDKTVLNAGESIIVPAEIKHQIRANSDFKGIHFMPKNIRFTFYD